MVVAFLQPLETKYINTKSSTQKNGFIDGKRVVVELEKPNFVWNGWSVRIALYFMIWLASSFCLKKFYRVAHSPAYSSQQGHLCLISEMLRSRRKVYLHRNDETNKIYIAFNTLKKKTFFSITARAASPGRISSGKLVRMVDLDVLQFQELWWILQAPLQVWHFVSFIV